MTRRTAATPIVILVAQHGIEVIAREARVREETVQTWCDVGRPTKIAARLLSILYGVDEDSLRPADKNFTPARYRRRGRA